MSRGYYNYDTRGASAASQIVNLERMVEERDQTIERLRDELRQSSIDHTRAEVERLRAALRAETVRCAKICEDYAQRCRDAGYDSEAAALRDAGRIIRA